MSWFMFHDHRWEFESRQTIYSKALLFGSSISSLRQTGCMVFWHHTDSAKTPLKEQLQRKTWGTASEEDFWWARVVIDSSRLSCFVGKNKNFDTLWLYNKQNSRWAPVHHLLLHPVVPCGQDTKILETLEKERKRYSLNLSPEAKRLGVSNPLFLCENHGFRSKGDNSYPGLFTICSKPI